MYPPEKLTRFIEELLKKQQVPELDACTAARVLIAAELRDIPSHGLLRLPDYLRLLKEGRIKPIPKIRVLHQTPSTALVDGDNGLGMVVSVKAMELAMEKAEKAGSGWVAVQNSNHYGIAGYYAMMALEKDMIGFCMTNANPLVAPTFSSDRLLGTNPIAVAVPADREPPVVADFATSSIARGKLDVLHKKGLPIKEGFVQDKEGNPSTDPSVLTQGGAILPLGGSREHGSHKGYCMASVVDILSAVLSGANFGPFVPPSVAYLPLKPNLPGKGTGHFFGALRIDAFQPASNFKVEMDRWIKTFREASPAKGQPEVMVPGDPERIAEEKNKKNGIGLLEKVKIELEQICKEENIPFPL